MSDQNDPYTQKPWIPPFHVPLEERIARVVPASRFVCNKHGFLVDRCCDEAVAIKKAKE